LTSLVTTVTETLRYRGAIGQWSWVLHRLTGLGVVFFFVLHVIDTSWALFYPELYVEAIATYQSPLFTIGEFGLVAAVVYHAINGLRIIFFDYRPNLWRYQQRAAVIVLIVTALILVPVFILMVGHVLAFYGDPNVQYLSIDKVLMGQLPFIAGFAVAIIVAILFSAIYGLIAGDTSKKNAGVAPRGSQFERFWWSYMRVSGLLIVPLVFGHLIIMHVLQGVFDITAQHAIVGTGGIINESGTAVEFVAARWNLMVFGGVAIWRVYDFVLLALVTIHGFNGLRYVLTDYTSASPLMHRAMVYVCVIAAVVLLIMGTGSLIGTIDATAIEMATEATAHLHP
jgi:succinate dehydrogenase / fumarate reductase cytochrome b subunit